MARWILCGGDFEIGDVVRWTEGVWHSKRKKKKRRVTRLGTREVTAQVMTCDQKDYVYLSVLKCGLLETRYSGEIKPLKKEQVIKRKRGTLARGGGERLAGPPEAPVRRLSKFGELLKAK